MKVPAAIAVFLVKHEGEWCSTKGVKDPVNSFKTNEEPIAMAVAKKAAREAPAKKAAREADPSVPAPAAPAVPAKGGGKGGGCWVCGGNHHLL